MTSNLRAYAKNASFSSNKRAGGFTISTRIMGQFVISCLKEVKEVRINNVPFLSGVYRLYKEIKELKI